MRFNRRRAIVLVLPRFTAEKQERVVLPFIAEQGYILVSVTADPDSAVALVAAGLVDVVVAATNTALTDELAEVLAIHGGELALARPNPHRRVREDRAAATIKRAAERGLSAQDIAAILELDLERVLGVLGPSTPPGARPGRINGHPVGAYR